MYDKMEKPDEMDAKMSVLQELRDMAMEMMGERMPKDGEPQSVSVSSNSPEGLHEGLEMAQEMMPSESDDELPDDLEEVEAMIRELEDKRRKLLMGS